ncbi:small conductance mechanosensitive ion channel family [Cystoisospora suis]|uniref:Small conductance mechanosensitive ion channel family n=1 Tax=Cystoisospora suis TaxID=483139 RepID=A0A2C6LDT2_9APIC|nr:small conductance mechanosensitive ion channel family [Cystoisospora suis]
MDSDLLCRRPDFVRGSRLPSSSLRYRAPRCSDPVVSAHEPCGTVLLSECASAYVTRLASQGSCASPCCERDTSFVGKRPVSSGWEITSSPTQNQRLSYSSAFSSVSPWVLLSWLLKGREKREHKQKSVSPLFTSACPTFSPLVPKSLLKCHCLMGLPESQPSNAEGCPPRNFPKSSTFFRRCSFSSQTNLSSARKFPQSLLLAASSSSRPQTVGSSTASCFSRAAARTWFFLRVARACIAVFFRGMLDCLSVHRFVFFFLRSPEICQKSLSCILLNGGLFLGSIQFFSHVVMPLVVGMTALGICLVASFASLYVGFADPAAEGQGRVTRLSRSPATSDVHQDLFNGTFCAEAVAGSSPGVLSKAFFAFFSAFSCFSFARGGAQEVTHKAGDRVAEWLVPLVEWGCWGAFRYMVLYPLYCCNSLFNSLWYRDIADTAAGMLVQDQLPIAGIISCSNVSSSVAHRSTPSNVRDTIDACRVCSHSSAYLLEPKDRQETSGTHGFLRERGNRLYRSWLGSDDHRAPTERGLLQRPVSCAYPCLESSEASGGTFLEAEPCGPASLSFSCSSPTRCASSPCTHVRWQSFTPDGRDGYERTCASNTHKQATPAEVGSGVPGHGSNPSSLTGSDSSGRSREFEGALTPDCRSRISASLILLQDGRNAADVPSYNCSKFWSGTPGHIAAPRISSSEHRNREAVVSVVGSQSFASNYSGPHTLSDGRVEARTASCGRFAWWVSQVRSETVDAEEGRVAFPRTGTVSLPSSVSPFESVLCLLLHYVWWVTACLLLPAIPLLGPFLSMLNLSWLFAFYCFDWHTQIPQFPQVSVHDSRCGGGTVCPQYRDGVSYTSPLRGAERNGRVSSSIPGYSGTSAVEKPSTRKGLADEIGPLPSSHALSVTSANESNSQGKVASGRGSLSKCACSRSPSSPWCTVAVPADATAKLQAAVSAEPPTPTVRLDCSVTGDCGKCRNRNVNSCNHQTRRGSRSGPDWAIAESELGEKSGVHSSVSCDGRQADRTPVRRQNGASLAAELRRERLALLMGGGAVSWKEGYSASTRCGTVACFRKENDGSRSLRAPTGVEDTREPSSPHPNPIINRQIAIRHSASASGTPQDSRDLVSYRSRAAAPAPEWTPCHGTGGHVEVVNGKCAGGSASSPSSASLRVHCGNRSSSSHSGWVGSFPERPFPHEAAADSFSGLSVAMRQRMVHFEEHWVYFAGFGAPLWAVQWLCPSFVDYGVLAMLFPVCIVTSLWAVPLRWVKTEDEPLMRAHPLLERLPIFTPVRFVTGWILQLVLGYLTPRIGKEPQKVSEVKERGKRTWLRAITRLAKEHNRWQPGTELYGTQLK